MGYYLSAACRIYQFVRIGGFYPRPFRQDMSDRIGGCPETDTALRTLNRIDPEDILSGTLQVSAVSTQKIKAFEIYPVQGAFSEKKPAARQRKKNDTEQHTERIRFSSVLPFAGSFHQYPEGCHINGKKQGYPSEARKL
jgi:hypothetical protein